MKEDLVIYPVGIGSEEQFGEPAKTTGGISPDYLAAEALAKADEENNGQGLQSLGIG